MARPRAREIDRATSERLLDAAEAEFGRVGFHAARLEDIARTAGITRPSLLYHFGTKGALYAAVVRRAFADLGAALAGGIAGPAGFVARLDSVVGRYTRFLGERPSVPSLILRDLLDGTGPGSGLLLEEVVPVIAWVERFIMEEGRGAIRPGLPVRAALMQVAAAELVRAAAGPLEQPLWGRGDHARTLVRTLLFGK